MLLTWFIYANAVLSRGWVMGKKSGGAVGYTKTTVYYTFHELHARSRWVFSLESNDFPASVKDDE
jgi:hypothetical protein